MLYHYAFKFIIIGDTAVGKSCLLLQFTQNKFRNDHDLTIGAQFGSKTITHQDQDLYLQIWDTAGQQNFRSVVRSYYRNAAIAVLVYDITRRESFQNLTRWLEQCREEGNPSMYIVLVGNKTDLQNQRVVSRNQGQAFAEKYQIPFFQTSARSNVNVNDVFVSAAYTLHRKILSKEIDHKDETNGIRVGIPSNSVKTTRVCCRS